MGDLWAGSREKVLRGVQPLALRMRPRSLGEFAGQSHVLGEGKLLRRMLSADAVTSIILHGPPGTGKTTLAELIATTTRRAFVKENAASVGVARIREIIADAERLLLASGRRTILFLDEIHRFSKAQQDVLLGDVERGLITLIGATTENPLFAVNSALVSRSTLFRLEPLRVEEVLEVLRRALTDPERGYGTLRVEASEEALRLWAIKCDGDARRALTALEVAVLSATAERPGAGTAAEPIVIDRQAAEDSIQQKAAVFDTDQHYDLASAMIKSIRGGDPDAALYWIARMLEGGEDPRFIARRLAILASEDIGNAEPRALPVAAACYQLVERIGMPECRITLAQTACFLALCPKSNAAYLAIDAALADVREGRTVAVPMHIKDGNVRKAAELSADGPRGEPYQYSHDNPDGVGRQDYLGVEKRYYQPTEHGEERELGKALERNRARREPDRP